MRKITVYLTAGQYERYMAGGQARGYTAVDRDDIRQTLQLHVPTEDIVEIKLSPGLATGYLILIKRVDI